MVPGDDHGSVVPGRRRPQVVRPAGQRTGHVMSSATYRTLLRAPGAAAFFLTAAVGRAGIAMTSLGIVCLLHPPTPSYAPPGLVAAGGVVAGATSPQLGGLSAARWAALLRDERAAALPTAFTLEALANELAYLAGPALVSILGASGYPAAGTVLAAALVVAGGLCFAAQRRTAPPASGAAGRHHAGRWLLRPGFAVLAGVALAIGGVFCGLPLSSAAPPA